MVMKEYFGANRFGQPTELYTLCHPDGLLVKVMTHGATIVSLKFPSRYGKETDLVLGHNSAAEYAGNTPYFGSTIGRFANRIKNGQFSLDGQTFQLSRNNGSHSLHGGNLGFDKRIWQSESLPELNAVRMHYLSVEGEEGYPGTVQTSVTFSLPNPTELRLEYHAETTQPTPFCITNHSYFNLAGHNTGSIANHLLQIPADQFLTLDKTFIPLEYRSVEGTMFDFRTMRRIGDGLESDDEQITSSKGYGHTFCLKKRIKDGLSLAARVAELRSGMNMEVFTTEPGLIFYTGNFIKAGLQGKHGCTYAPHHGFCLETQHYPDSPNRLDFPDTILRPGEIFKTTTLFRFLPP